MSRGPNSRYPTRVVPYHAKYDMVQAKGKFSICQGHKNSLFIVYHYKNFQIGHFSVGILITLVLTILIWLVIIKSGRDSVDLVDRSENVRISGTLTTVARSHDDVDGNDAVFPRETVRAAGDAFQREFQATSHEFAEDIRQNQERMANQLASTYATHVTNTLAYRYGEQS